MENKSFTITVTSCKNCPYRRYVDEKDRDFECPKFENENPLAHPRAITYMELNSIPDWCPKVK